MKIFLLTIVGIFIIYKQEKSIIGLSEPEKSELIDISILMII